MKYFSLYIYIILVVTQPFNYSSNKCDVGCFCQEERLVLAASSVLENVGQQLYEKQLFEDVIMLGDMLSNCDTMLDYYSKSLKRGTEIEPLLNHTLLKQLQQDQQELTVYYSFLFGKSKKGFLGAKSFLEYYDLKKEITEHRIAIIGLITNASWHTPVMSHYAGMQRGAQQKLKEGSADNYQRYMHITVDAFLYYRSLCEETIRDYHYNPFLVREPLSSLRVLLMALLETEEDALMVPNTYSDRKIGVLDDYTRNLIYYDQDKPCDLAHYIISVSPKVLVIDPHDLSAQKKQFDFDSLFFFLEKYKLSTHLSIVISNKSGDASASLFKMLKTVPNSLHKHLDFYILNTPLSYCHGVALGNIMSFTSTRNDVSEKLFTSLDRIIRQGGFLPSELKSYLYFPENIENLRRKEKRKITNMECFIDIINRRSRFVPISIISKKGVGSSGVIEVSGEKGADEVKYFVGLLTNVWETVFNVPLCEVLDISVEKHLRREKMLVQFKACNSWCVDNVAEIFVEMWNIFWRDDVVDLLPLQDLFKEKSISKINEVLLEEQIFEEKIIQLLEDLIEKEKSFLEQYDNYYKLNRTDVVWEISRQWMYLYRDVLFLLEEEVPKMRGTFIDKYPVLIFEKMSKFVQRVKELRDVDSIELLEKNYQKIRVLYRSFRKHLKFLRAFFVDKNIQQKQEYHQYKCRQYEKQLELLFDPLSNKPLSKSELRPVVKVCTSGMGAFSIVAHLVNTFTEKNKKCFVAENTYFELPIIMKTLFNNHLGSFTRDEEGVKELFDAIKAGECRAVILDPLANDLYCESIDLHNLFVMIKETDFTSPFFVVIDATLLGPQLQINDYIDQDEIPDNCTIFVIHSGIKFLQYGYDLASEGMIVMYTNSSLTSSVVSQLIDYYRINLGMLPSLYSLLLYPVIDRKRLERDMSLHQYNTHLVSQYFDDLITKQSYSPLFQCAVSSHRSKGDYFNSPFLFLFLSSNLAKTLLFSKYNTAKPEMKLVAKEMYAIWESIFELFGNKSFLFRNSFGFVEGNLSKFEELNFIEKEGGIRMLSAFRISPGSQHTLGVLMRLDAFKKTIDEWLKDNFSPYYPSFAMQKNVLSEINVMKAV